MFEDSDNSQIANNVVNKNQTNIIPYKVMNKISDLEICSVQHCPERRILSLISAHYADHLLRHLKQALTTAEDQPFELIKKSDL